MNFHDFFNKKLPAYFKKEDSYKDSSGKGLLERFLEIFGDEIDDELRDQIEDYTKIVDPIECDEKFLNHIAYTLGFPPDLFGNVTEYRRFLSMVISIYKVKGTLKSYQALFGFFGYSIYLMMIYKNCTYYDTEGVLYDNGEFYDTCCPPCLEYNLIIGLIQDQCWNDEYLALPHARQPINWGNPSQEVEDLIHKILCFLEPINAKLGSVIPGLFICEKFESQINEAVSVEFRKAPLYDVGHAYDGGVDYDSETVTTQLLYP